MCFQQNGRAKSHDYETFHGYQFLSHTVVIWIKMTKQAFDLILGPCLWRSWNCSRYSNKKQSNDENHLASDEHRQICKNMWTWAVQTPRTQSIKHRANHSSTVLFLSINSHMCRANHCNTALEYEKLSDLLKSATRIVDTRKHYKLSNKRVTEVSTDMWNCLIELE